MIKFFQSYSIVRAKYEIVLGAIDNSPPQAMIYFIYLLDY